MIVYGVIDTGTGEQVEFPSNPVDLFPSEEAAEAALEKVNAKKKEEDKIIGAVMAYSTMKIVPTNRLR